MDAAAAATQPPRHRHVLRVRADDPGHHLLGGQPAKSTADFSPPAVASPASRTASRSPVTIPPPRCSVSPRDVCAGCRCLHLRAAVLLRRLADHPVPDGRTPAQPGQFATSPTSPPYRLDQGKVRDGRGELADRGVLLPRGTRWSVPASSSSSCCSASTQRRARRRRRADDGMRHLRHGRRHLGARSSRPACCLSAAPRWPCSRSASSASRSTS